jgi:hypothetical protein
MTQISSLPSIDSISGSDLLLAYSSDNVANSTISIADLINYILTQANQITLNQITQYATPITGATVTIVPINQSNVWLILTPASTLATLTVKLPEVSTCIDKQEVLINNNAYGVTTLTIDANGASSSGLPSTLAASSSILMRFDLVTKTWFLSA